MIPLLFGSSEKPLFGIYNPAVGHGQRRGVVLCPPLGQEYIRSHRTCRVLAERLAEAGQHVLRYDYFGTGDSGGEADELTLEGAVRDARAGMAEIRDAAHVQRTTLVGLRAGALVATLAAREARHADRLVLWDPVSDGADYVATEIHVGEPVGPDGDREAYGFLFSRALQEELAGTSLTGIDAFPSEVLLVVSEDLDRHRRLAQHVRTTGSDVEIDVLESPPCWEEAADLGLGAVPARALGRIAAW